MEFLDSKIYWQMVHHNEDVVHFILPISNVLSIWLPAPAEIECTKVGGLISVRSDDREKFKFTTPIPMQIHHSGVPNEISDKD